MNKPFLPFKKCLKLTCLTSLSLMASCTLGPISGGGLQIYPSSTTVYANQSLTFQVTGGVSPYQFQVSSGVGSIDNNGNFMAGAIPGQSQITAQDSSGLTGYASVSVVQNAWGSYPSNGSYPNNSYPNGSNPNGSYPNSSYASLNSSSNSGLLTASIQESSARFSLLNQSSYNTEPSEAKGWTLLLGQNFIPSPTPMPIFGALVGVDTEIVDSQGDKVYSKFVATSLKHPLIRVDRWIKAGDGKVLAKREVVEDQFLVELKSGYTEDELLSILKQDGAHISNYLKSDRTYLVSLDRRVEEDLTQVSASLIQRRKKLKLDLQSIGIVTPNYIR